MTQLVLSLFPGIDLLGMAFELEGFCVVRGPDVIFGGDIRNFHPPAGRFDGVIGGPPCQSFSRLAHMVRHNGHQPKFGNLIPEFERCVNETKPKWFIMENVAGAPIPFVDPRDNDYAIHSFLLNNRQLGEAQNRVRRWTFGHLNERRVLNIDTVALENADFQHAATGGTRSVPVAIGGSGKIKKRYDKPNGLPFNDRSEIGYKRLCDAQGVEPPALPGWTVAGKCQAVGNGVPIAMGRAIARAVKEAIGFSAESAKSADETI